VACEMIRAVKEGGAQIVNLSLGGHTLDNVPPVALQAALETITEWEHETGQEVLIVAAAGDYADTTPCWPAAFRRVVSVASLAPDMSPSPVASTQRAIRPMAAARWPGKSAVRFAASSKLSRQR